MSDDEEIICKGTDLYTHLMSQGYVDFETFSPTSGLADLKLGSKLFKGGKEITNKNDHSSRAGLNKQFSRPISFNDFEKFGMIIGSQLLFKEDVDHIETVLSECCVVKATSKWFWYISTLVSGFLSSIAMYKKDFKFIIPCGFSTLLASYSFWRSFKESAKARQTVEWGCHIDLLKTLCSNVHKLLRLLKEIEILACGQSSHKKNLSSTMYIPVKTNDIKEFEISPCWKTLPHLRKCLSDSLIDVIEMFTAACDILEQMSPPFLVLENSAFSLPESLKTINAEAQTKQCISLKELQKLDETYLSLQSRYLKLLSYCSCSSLYNSFEQKTNVEEVFILRPIRSLQQNLTDISFKLQMQYNIHNIFPPTYRPSHIDKKFLKGPDKHVNLQSQVHNMFVLMLSMLLRVRNVEDYLDNVQCCSQNDNQNMTTNVSKQLVLLKDDLSSTVKCFDLIYQQCFNETKNHDVEKISGSVSEEEITLSNTKRTGIVVGKSNFNVNSPDEVFLAISGVNSEEQELYVDEWFDVKKPKIPKNLLSELSNRLQMRKECFNVRERLALIRQGLQDFDENTVGVDKNDFDEKLDFKKATNLVKQPASIDFSDDEGSFNFNISYKRIKQAGSYKIGFDSEDSSTDEENILKAGSTKNSTPDVNRSSLANLVAMKSQSWGNTSEECFSD